MNGGWEFARTGDEKASQQRPHTTFTKHFHSSFFSLLGEESYCLFYFLFVLDTITMNPSESLSSVSPAFIGDATIFQNYEADPNDHKVPSAGTVGSFKQLEASNAPYDYEYYDYCDDADGCCKVIPAKFTSTATFLHDNDDDDDDDDDEEEHHGKKRSSFDATVLANDARTPPKLTKLSRSSAIYILPEDFEEENGLEVEGKNVGWDDASEEEEEEESYARYVPPSAPRKLRRESTLINMDDEASHERPFEADPQEDVELEFGNMTLDCSYESPMVAQWKKETRASLGVVTTAFKRTSSFLKARSFYATTKTPPAMTATSTLKAPPSYAMAKTPPKQATRSSGTLYDDVEPKAPQPVSKRVSWLYPNGAPDDSTTTIVQPKAVKAAVVMFQEEQASSKTTQTSKQVSRLFPNGIPDDSRIVQPIPVRAVTSPKEQGAWSLKELNSVTTCLPSAPQVVRSRAQRRRFSYPTSLPKERVTEIEMKKVSLFPPRATRKLYPSLESIRRSPTKGGEQMAYPVNKAAKQMPFPVIKGAKQMPFPVNKTGVMARRNTLPLFGTAPQTSLLSTFDVLQEDSAFVHYARKRRSSFEGGERSHVFGQGAFHGV